MKLNGLKAKFAAGNTELDPARVNALHFRKHALSKVMNVHLGEKTIACRFEKAASPARENLAFLEKCHEDTPVNVNDEKGRVIFSGPLRHFMEVPHIAG